MHWKLRQLAWKASLLATTLSLVGITVALAASGDLDGSFSGDGMTTAGYSGVWDARLEDIAQQADDKLVAVGTRTDSTNPDTASRDFAVMRFDTDGSRDATFNGSGKVNTNFGDLDEAYGVAIQLNQKIVVAGQTCNDTFTLCDLAVARYNTDGSPDMTFDGDGKAILDFADGDNGSLGGLLIQPDGKIVVAGYMWNGSDRYDFAVYRLNTNGSPDAGWDGDGRKNLGFGAGRQDEAHELILHGGTIVVAGLTCDSAWAGCNFAVARLLSSGDLDSSFSGDGKQTTDFGANDSAYGLALQPNEKLMVVGESRTTLDVTLAMSRYLTNGNLDTTFHADGKRTLDYGARTYGRKVVALASGGTVVAGSTCDSGFFFCNFAMFQFQANGALDNSFSGNGRLSINFGGNEDATTLIQQSNGNYVVGGTYYDGSKRRFAIARVKE